MAGVVVCLSPKRWSTHNSLSWQPRPNCAFYCHRRIPRGNVVDRVRLSVML